MKTFAPIFTRRKFSFLWDKCLRAVTALCDKYMFAFLEAEAPFSSLAA